VRREKSCGPSLSIANVYREGGRSLVDSEYRSWTRWSRKVGDLVIRQDFSLVAKGERVAVDAPFPVGLATLPSTPHFLWITQFPLFTHADEDKSFLSRGRWASSHHPFTAPMWEDLADLKMGKVEGVRGQHYDLVLNGQEIGGGSVRIHDPKLQEYVMREVLQVSLRYDQSYMFSSISMPTGAHRCPWVPTGAHWFRSDTNREAPPNGWMIPCDLLIPLAQLTPEEMGRFSHLLQALKCGAPPHGGIALGEWTSRCSSALPPHCAPLVRSAHAADAPSQASTAS
jgi:hypothetical protein